MSAICSLWLTTCAAGEVRLHLPVRGASAGSIVTIHEALTEEVARQPHIRPMCKLAAVSAAAAGLLETTPLVGRLRLDVGGDLRARGGELVAGVML
jgi:hypothetical protein